MAYLIGASVGLFEPTEAWADGVAVGAATPQQKQSAQKLYSEALAKSEKKDHAGALAGFQASFEVVASPNAKLMIGKALLALDRHAEAHDVLHESIELATLAADPKYDKTKAQAEDYLRDLAPKIGKLKIDLAGRTGDVTIAGRVVPAAALLRGVAVPPGEVEIELVGPEGRESRKVTATAGQETAVSFLKVEIAPPPPAPSDSGNGAAMPLLVAGGVVGGIGVVGLGLFAAFGAMTLGNDSDLREQCTNNVCPPTLREDVDSAKTQQTLANVGAIVGAVGLAVGAGLLIPGIVLSGGDETSASPKTEAFFGPGTVVVRSSF
jgi:hypothetical protein